MALVANLSVAVGARPHFDRPNFPVEPGYFPSDVVLRLTPFNEETLDHFVFIERPQGVMERDGESFAEEPDYSRGEAVAGVMPNLQDYGTVGHLYEMLRAHLVAFAEQKGEEVLFAGGTDGQLSPDLLGLENFALISDLGSACAAIDRIVEEGEGSPADRGDSHYRRFTSIQEEFRQLQVRNSAFEPAWPATENPVFRRPAEPEGKTYIDEPSSAAVLDLALGAYGLLLRLLVQAFGRAGEEAKRQLLGTAIGLMHVVATAGTELASMPASPLKPGINAGMTFSMLRGVEPFPSGAAERLLIDERLQELSAAADRLVARGWLPKKVALTLGSLTAGA
jgi:hypothetical protein